MEGDAKPDPEAVTLLMENGYKNGKVILILPTLDKDLPEKEKLFENDSPDPATEKLLVQNGDVGNGTIIKNGFLDKGDHELDGNDNATSIAIRDSSQQQDISEEKVQLGWKRYLGILFAIAAALNFSLSALVIKILKYHPFNLGVWRFSVMTLIPIPFLIHAKVKTKQSVLESVWPMQRTTFFLLLQAILGSNSILFVFFGLKYLNIADSIVIGTSAPVFVTLFAFMCLGERCGLVPVITALLALVGVGIISKPPILTGGEDLNGDTLIGVASSFSSMILLTFCYIVIRYLRKVHHALINLCFALWGLLQSIILASLTGVLELPRNYEEVGLVILTAFLAFFAQTCLTIALKYEQAGPVALVRTSEVVFAFLWQAIFLGVQPDFFSILGAIVTLSGVVLTALRKMVMSLPEEHKYRKRFSWLLL